MSQLTNYAENLIADYFRGQGVAALPTQFYVGLASDASDTAFTELGGTGYARQPYGRGLTQWSGTQGPATTLASNGASHSSSNNNAISFGTSGASWGTAAYVVLYDALTSGNILAYFPLPTPLSIGSGTPVSFAAGAISFTLGLAGGVSNFLANKLIDLVFRAQAYVFPSTGYFGLFTTAPTDAGGGVEVVAAGAYARQSTPFSLIGFSGTQAAGSTVASTGSSGIISNNLALAFPSPTSNWGTITHEGVFDAPTGGNLLFWNALDVPRTVLSGSSPQTHAPGSWSITVA